LCERDAKQCLGVAAEHRGRRYEALMKSTRLFGGTASRRCNTQQQASSYTNVGRDSNRSDFLRCRAPASGWLLDDEIEPSWTERMKSCSCARVRKRNESRAYGTPQALLSTAAFSDMSLISTTQQDRARVCVSPAQHTHLLRFTSMVRFAQHAKLLLMRKARNHYAVHCQLGHIGFTQLPELPMRIMHHGSFTAGQSSSAKYVS
jgi:hypothetical protein